MDDAAIGDEAQVALENGLVQAPHAAQHGVFGIAVLELDSFMEQLLDLIIECGVPQLGFSILIAFIRSTPKL
jgi:hypothetical protein